MLAQPTRLCWLLICIAPTWAQDFVIEPMTPDVSLFEVKVGAAIWVKYGEHKIKVLPKELAGIQGLRRPPYSAVRFRVNKPARVFWVSHHHLLPGGRPPEGWRVFRQRAFQSTAERHREMDVYYRDYAAGECQVRFPYRSISVGIKPMDSTDVGDMALHVASCSPRIVFRLEDDVALNVTVNNPTAKAQACSVKYTVARADRHLHGRRERGHVVAQ